MHSKPKVSVVLYVDDDLRFLEKSVKSCLNQTHQNVELIIVDDTGGGLAEEILSRSRDPRIRYICHDAVSGFPRSLNEGLAKAEGDYLTWMSGKSQYAPRAFEEMLNFKGSHPDVDFVYADYQIEYTDTNFREDQITTDYREYSRHNIWKPCFLMTRKVYETLGGCNVSLDQSVQYDYWVKVSMKFIMWHLPHILSTSFEEKLTNVQRIERSFTILCNNIILYREKCISYEDFNKAVSYSCHEFRKSTHGWGGYVRVLSRMMGRVILFSGIWGVWINILLVYYVFDRKLHYVVKRLSGPFKRFGRWFLLLRIGLGAKKAPDKINVLCIVPQMVVGGSEKVVWDIVRGLASQGYAFHLLCSRKENNVWCQNFSTSFHNVIYLNKPYLYYFEDADRDYYAVVRSLIKKLNIKVVLLSNPLPAYRYIEQIKKDFPDVKVMDVVHVDNFGGALEEAAAGIPFLDQRVCISHGLKKYIAELYRSTGIDSGLLKRVEVIHNGNDMERFNAKSVTRGAFKSRHSIDNRTKVITYVGRVSPEKRPFLFVDIARYIFNKSPQEDFKFVMAGDGPDLEGVSDRVTHYGLKEKVILTGMVGVDEVRELLADSFLTLIVSYVEGLPLVMVESMAMGVPVITTDVGSVKEAITDGDNGFLVHPHERVVENFAERILMLHSNKDLYDKISQRTRESIEKEFSLEMMARRYADVFERFKIR